MESSSSSNDAEVIRHLAPSLRSGDLSDEQLDLWSELMERVSNQKSPTPELQQALFGVLYQRTPIWIGDVIVEFLASRSTSSWKPMLEALVLGSAPDVSYFHAQLIDPLQDRALLETLVSSAESVHTDRQALPVLIRRLEESIEQAPNSQLAHMLHRLESTPSGMEYLSIRERCIAAEKVLYQREDTKRARECFKQGNYKEVLRLVKDYKLDPVTQKMADIARRKMGGA